jgi:acyl-coenzyme A thioesterase PaaI-like protein
MSDERPLQDQIHKDNPIRNCFGCGANNEHGLRIKSFNDGDDIVAHWKPHGAHCSYPGFLNGGIASTLIDCHSAWAAFALECRERGLNPQERPEDLPAGWTKTLKVEFLRPTPITDEVVLRAKVVRKGNTSRTVECSLYADGEECVKGEVVIVFAKHT